MTKVRNYIVDGTTSWEEVRNYMVYNLRGFTKILSEHQLSAIEFHCIMPFFKEICNCSEPLFTAGRFLHFQQKLQSMPHRH